VTRHAEARTAGRSLLTRHVPALDGIRGLSVAAVLCFHGGVSWASGGFLGVDAFFVLSGYLITALLVREWDRRGAIDLVAFWGRRARRLLPALLLVVTVVVLLAPGILPPVEVRLLRGDALAALFDVANWRMIARGEGYFEQTAAPSPLQHTWSLGIEEQFYLVWPLLLVLLLRGRRPLRRMLVVCAVGAVASAVWLGLLHDAMDPARAYFGTDTRAASLLIGAALAAALADGRGSGSPLGTGARRIVSLLAAAGVVFTGWAWTELSGDDIRLYRGGLLLAALAVAAVIAHVVVAPEGLSARVLSIPPLPALGRISYGVYLWHWPVFIAVNADRTGLQGTSLFGLRCLVTIVVATLSYVLLERPVRTSRMSASRSLNGGLVLGAVAATVAAVLVTTSVPQRASDVARQPTTDGANGTGGIDGIDRVAPPPTQASASRSHGDGPPSPTPSSRRRSPGDPVVVDVFGDSVAWSLVTYLPEHPGLDIRDRTSLGCGVSRTAPYRYFGRTYPRLLAKCRDWPARWTRAVARDDPDVALVLVGRWETMDRVLDGRWTHVGDRAFDAHLRSQLRLAIAVAGSRGARVLLATEPYNRRGEQPDGSVYPEDQPQRVTDWNRLVRRVAAETPHTEVVDLGRRVSPEGRFTWTAGGIQVRSDGLHLTPSGVQRWIAPWLLPRLRASVGP
jgi:peptidoglycan/LPS O-acetylase OafA/YrhL